MTDKQLAAIAENINALGTQIADMRNGNVKRDQEIIELKRQISALKRDKELG